MRWEYGYIQAWSGSDGRSSCTVDIPGSPERKTVGDASSRYVKTLLADLGVDGWELAAAESHHNVTVYWLKRQWTSL